MLRSGKQRGRCAKEWPQKQIHTTERVVLLPDRTSDSPTKAAEEAPFDIIWVLFLALVFLSQKWKTQQVFSYFNFSLC